MREYSADRSAQLFDLACAFAARAELDELIPFVIRKIREVLRAESAAVILLDREADQLYFPFVSVDHADTETRLRAVRFPASSGIAGAVLASGNPILQNRVETDPTFYPGIDTVTGMTTRAILAVPLRSPSGPLGVLEVMNPVDDGRFSTEDLEFSASLARSIEVALENGRIRAELRDANASLRTRAAALRRDLSLQRRFWEIVGTSEAMLAVTRLMETAAASTMPVLVEGETGTGKELVARGIHQASERFDAPFIAVNCAAIPDSMLESELFGHRRGAFTGAVEDRCGFFEAANGGTIFLDEIGDMPPASQAKLLRVLEEREITRLGETRPRPIDVRVISATNVDLGSRVRAKVFREDLYYRIAPFPILLPPLRERKDDVPLLASRFLAFASEETGKRSTGIARPAVARLMEYDWPGNVRELRNEIVRAVALAPEGGPIGVEHLSERVSTDGGRTSSSAARIPADVPVEPLLAARSRFEKDYVAAALRQHEGNVSVTARALGLSRTMLKRKLKQYGIVAEELRVSGRLRR